MSGEKLKIAYLGRYNENEILTGPEKTAKRIFEENKNFHEPVFIQYFFDGRKYGIFKKLFGYEINDNLITAGLLKLFLLLFKLKPDIIHIITFERFAYIALLYSLIKKVKIIYNSHGIIKFEDSELKKEKRLYKFKNRFVEKRLLLKSDVIIFHSDKAKELCEKYYKINPKKCLIIPNGIDAEFHNAAGNVNRNGCVFLAGGRLHESARMFLRRFLDFSSIIVFIHIIGNKKYCINFNKSSVSITEKMNSAKLAEFYKDKQIFLSLNNYDTFSISAAEAMASGLIPIVTADTGISQYIKNGENGFVVNYGDISQLENLISDISKKSSDRLNLMSENAKNIYNDLNWPKIYNMYDNIYHLIRK